MTMKDRRKVKDGRSQNLCQDQQYSRNRRFRPCRRLNSISAKWISREMLIRHPIIWFKFRQIGFGQKTTEKEGL